MILLRVVSRSREKINKAARLLFDEKLCIDLNLKSDIERIEYVEGKQRLSKVFLLTAKTKGLLFPLIDKKMRQLFPDQMPEVYSIPIIHMDWQQSEQLIEDVRGV